MTWKRLIRFVANDGKIYRGEPIVTDAEYDVGKQLLQGKTIKAKVVKGDIFKDAVVTDEVLEVKQLLGPLNQDDVPIIKCVGLNYMKHIQEGGRTPPPYPSIFYKPRFSVADFGEPIPIPRIAQENQCDYEGELCVVIGKTGKDIKEAEALSYVAGYVSGNDVSARTWQRDPKYAGDPAALELTTRVNGEVRQHTGTDDLLFNVAKIISFISQSTTLEQGTVIMTGTPIGVAMGMKEPKFLQHNDEVEVEISQIGTLSNKMDFV
ncbi:hypothetical protein I9W82_001506 [Candida metapsilosis]|uniref:Fumarylacetoacetase-like C-terminal domain-containing protein n=1 Tax=Candida metapsilosis TaxID=273372 RepID=A0A8H7ZIR6_9ASCO|nr:hypothetical protein I9W82_001506 [Candida metapsilosis]